MKHSTFMSGLLVVLGALLTLPACSTASPVLQETRELELAAADASKLAIDAGSGSLAVEGRADLDHIRVTAEIHQHQPNDDYTLRLAPDSQGRILLESHAGKGWGNDRIDLIVLVPAELAVGISDGSGSIKVQGLQSGLVIVDGSGSIELANLAGEVRVEDGSGSIRVTHVDGDLRIEDGSGSIRVEDIDGDIRITDGSGSISVQRASGKVTISDGSGSIEVVDAGEFELLEDGSGSVTTRNVGADFSD